MLAPETEVAASVRCLPTRPPIEGPSAWIGADMRAREGEWTYRLSPQEHQRLPRLKFGELP